MQIFLSQLVHFTRASGADGISDDDDLSLGGPSDRNADVCEWLGLGNGEESSLSSDDSSAPESAGPKRGSSAMIGAASKKLSKTKKRSSLDLKVPPLAGPLPASTTQTAAAPQVVDEITVELYWFVKAIPFKATDTPLMRRLCWEIEIRGVGSKAAENALSLLGTGAGPGAGANGGTTATASSMFGAKTGGGTSSKAGDTGMGGNGGGGTFVCTAIAGRGRARLGSCSSPLFHITTLHADNGASLTAHILHYVM